MTAPLLSRRRLLTAAALGSTALIAEAGRERVAAGGPADTASSDPTLGRTLVFDERFAVLDRRVWNAGPKATTSPNGFYGRSAFARFDGQEGVDPYKIVDDAAATDGRALEISAVYVGRPMRITNYYGNDHREFQWISGNIQTARIDGTVERGWRNGYFEARMRFPRHPLTWPGFWLLNGNSILSPATSVEIDIVEHKGWEPHVYGTYLHEWGGREHHEGTGARSSDDLTHGYFRYGMLVDGARCIPHFERRPVIDPQTGRVAEWSMVRSDALDAAGDVFWPLLTLALRTDVPFPDPLLPEHRQTAMRVDYVAVYV